MTQSAIHTENPRASWLAFLASPAAPKRPMSVLELDGYLTGVIVAPTVIPPSLWMASLWVDEEPVFDNDAQIQSVLGGIGAMLNSLRTSIEQSLLRLEFERVCDYRPAFQATDGKPSHEAVRMWVRGFQRAMEFAPSEWHALAADDRTQVIVMPLIGFMDLGDETFEPAEDIDDRLDEAAAFIPRSVLLLRKIAQLRASRSGSERQTPRDKIGRNDPCPCGSGKKFKRCCHPA